MLDGASDRNKEDLIFEFISSQPGLQAKWVAKLLDLPKKEVDSVIRGTLRVKVEKDSYRGL